MEITMEENEPRTEIVTLKITHISPLSAADWDWSDLLVLEPAFGEAIEVVNTKETSNE